jgi:hypothetical protein
MSKVKDRQGGGYTLFPCVWPLFVEMRALHTQQKCHLRNSTIVMTSIHFPIFFPCLTKLIVSSKCGYWDTVKTFWIILILVRYRQFHLSKHLTFLLLKNYSLWKSINTSKNIIYNAFIFTMVSNLFRWSLQFFFVTN